MPWSGGSQAVTTSNSVISAGALNRRITIQKQINTPDGEGGYSIAWATFISTFAKVDSNAGSEPYFADQLYPHAQFSITIRYRKGIIPGMRILLGTHTLRIRSIVDPTYEHVYLTLRCEELQAEGAVL